MRKHIWLDRNYSGDTVEIIVRDGSRAKLGSWTINVRDKKRAKQVMKVLKKTYGIDFGIKFNDDLEWLE